MQNYIPDSIYLTCMQTQDNCGDCNNVVYSNLLRTKVTDTQREYVFCPFGRGNGFNQSIESDQNYLFKTSPQNYATKWGRAPQMDPRPLSKIGLEWRTS